MKENNKKDLINNLCTIIFFVLILFLISSIILNKPLTDLDEMWNYNFSKNILEGRLPYKDFNIIQMPLVPYIGTIFLIIFGNQLLSMRILAIIISFLILYFSYLILKEFKVNKYINLLSIIGIVYLFEQHFRVDYNFFLLLILLIIIYIELKNKEYFNKISHKTDIAIGILVGICICTKQTTGICVALVSILYKFIFVKDKDSFKIFIKKASYRIIGIMLPILVLVIYFTLFDLWKDFIDYSILGIRTFTNKISYFNLIKSDNIIIKIFSIIIPLFIFIELINILTKKLKSRNISASDLILFAYSCASIVVVYPISDEIHFLVGALPVILLIIIKIYQLLSKITTNKEITIFLTSFTKTIIVWTGMCILYYSFANMYNYFNICNKNNQINHFYYIPNSDYSRVKDVNEYIKNQNKKVYILDAQAVFYTIPLDQYNKNYDMLLKGNIGSKGEEKIINEIKTSDKIQVLVLNDKQKLNWQTPTNIINYTKENLTNIGNVGIFDIYENRGNK